VTLHLLIQHQQALVLTTSMLQLVLTLSIHTIGASLQPLLSKMKVATPYPGLLAYSIMILLILQFHQLLITH